MSHPGKVIVGDDEPLPLKHPLELSGEDVSWLTEPYCPNGRQAGEGEHPQAYNPSKKQKNYW